MLWLKKNAVPIIALVAVLLALGIAIWLKQRGNSDADRAATQVENSDLATLSEEIVKPARVERSSGRVVDQVDAELDVAGAPAPDDPAGGAGTIARAVRGDGVWRSGIERLRDPASRY